MVNTALHRRLPLMAVGIAVVLWSTSFGISSEVLKTASPAVLSVGRFAIGLIVLVPLAARRPLFARTLRDPRTILLGLLGVAIYYSLTNIGLEFTTPGTAALSNAALPALTALLGLFILKERLPPRTIVGLVLATAGVVIVAGAGLTVDSGVLLCLIGLASYSLYTVLLRKGVLAEPRERAAGGRQTAESVDPLVLATATAVWGTAIMLPWLVAEMAVGAAAIPSGWGGLGGLLVLGVVITAPTLVLFNFGAERLPAAATGVLTAAIPALGYLFALVLGEPFDAMTALGGAVALVGVAIASVTAPSTDSSPAGSGLPPHEDVAAGTSAVD
ncbi:DMT family transporter [Cryobacterium sp. TMS1-20-1]|uniref:DMT family transporter n=1 Tax=unclassified Cryobacterium TaxID=2649013 RepID=UPI00106D7AF0|nr:MULTISPECIES: DMT family transporter [unclassified Cryobacterium]TFC80111.1 DMT family transporter [Cryobacterium sp. TMS1-20-1]TFD53617.1 DMT family transporter [Cryobacterium sp. Hh7]